MMRLNDDQAKALGFGHLIPAKPKRVASPDGMNKTERAYSQYLESRRRLDWIESWAFQPIKLKLAGRTFYTPDFCVVLCNGCVEFHETKGFMRDDAAVKIKVAAEKYPCFTFRLVYRRGSGWDIRHVGRTGIAAGGGTDHAT